MPTILEDGGRGESGAAILAAWKESLAVLAEESELQMRDLIRRRLALPIEKRTNFLRMRLPGGGSCL